MKIKEEWLLPRHAETWSIRIAGAPLLAVRTPSLSGSMLNVELVTVSTSWTSEDDGAATVALFGHLVDPNTAVKTGPVTFELGALVDGVPEWLEGIVIRALPCGVEVKWG